MSVRKGKIVQKCFELATIIRVRKEVSTVIQGKQKSSRKDLNLVAEETISDVLI